MFPQNTDTFKFVCVIRVRSSMMLMLKLRDDVPTFVNVTPLDYFNKGHQETEPGI